MNFRVFKKDLDTYKSALEKSGLVEQSESFKGYFSGNDRMRVDVKIKGIINQAFLDTMKETAESINDDITVIDCVGARQLLDNPNATVVKSLNGFIKAFDVFAKKEMIDGWLYSITKGEQYLPYLIQSIEKVPSDPERQIRAHVIITLVFTSPRSSDKKPKKTVIFHLEDVKGFTVSEILSKKHLFKETLELKNEYLNKVKTYDSYSNQIGSQFIGIGKGLKAERYSEGSINIEGHKLVNDEEHDLEMSIQQNIRVPFFSKYSSVFDFTEEQEIEIELAESRGEETYTEVAIPFHPFINVFNLEEHCNLWVLPDNLTPYEYDSGLHNKIILPEDHRDLIDVLVNDADVVLQDIVRGKSGGTTILSKGPAGTGKTLTAEVYSEIVEKPIYSVHSGQLGTSPDSIDKTLDTILKRAEKWGAILLLDEADVYIRERDNSMHHNSIVAAFLRRIERFNGIMFLTTNRSNDVDDAIISRCIAILDYKKPTKENLVEIWKVLSKNYDVKMDENLIKEFVEDYNDVSGRDVKEMLKLACKFISQKQDIEIDYDLFRKCAMFRGIKKNDD